MKKEPKVKTIQTVKVKRKVEKTISYVKMIEEDFEVELLDLTEKEIRSLDIEYCRAVAIGFKRLYEQAMKLNTDIVEETGILVERSNTILRGTESTIPPSSDSVNTNVHPEEKKTLTEGSTLNKKIGKSSKYHFVNIQNRNGKFYSFMASTSIGGKTVAMGADKDEIQCALLADAFLDKIGDEKRTRNRDDFPEIMKAYLLQVEAQKKKCHE